jgi:hypothetical protein
LIVINYVKRLTSVLALVGAALVSAYCVAQIVSLPEPAAGSNLFHSPGISAPAPLVSQLSSPFLFVTNGVAQTNFLYSLPTWKPIWPPRAHLFDSPTAVSNTLPPGLYKTEPYTCLVLVPGPHPDDKCIIGSRAVQPTEQMPMSQPELQFIPQKPPQ